MKFLRILFRAVNREFVQSYLKSGMTLIDAGAHVGQYSLLASGLVGARGTVHAFEPYPTLYAVLQRNLRRNRCFNVTASNVALSTGDGVHELFIGYAQNLGATSFTPSQSQYSGVSVSVPTTSLDQYAHSRSIGRVDLIKIDIEGAELDVLQGAKSVLRENPEIILIVEFCEPVAARFGRTTADLAAYLRQEHFELFRIDDDKLAPYRPMADEPVFFNVVCVREAGRCFVPGLP